MRVCVVGGTGNISTGIVTALLQFGHEVTVFTRGQRESRLSTGVRYLTGDRKDRPAFEATMQAEHFDAAIDMISYVEEDAASALRAFRDVSCPVAERIAAETGIGLPQHVLLGTHGDVDDVVAAIAKVTAHVDDLAAAPVAG